MWNLAIYSDHRKQKWQFSTNPLWYDAPYPANPHEYRHNPYILTKYSLCAIFPPLVWSIFIQILVMGSERQAHDVTEWVIALQGHRFWYQSKARVHIPISGQYTVYIYPYIQYRAYPAVHLMYVKQRQVKSTARSRESLPRLLSSTSTAAIYYYYSARKLIFYRPTEGRSIRVQTLKAVEIFNRPKTKHTWLRLGCN